MVSPGFVLKSSVAFHGFFVTGERKGEKGRLNLLLLINRTIVPYDVEGNVE